jgi:hypothetical protein
MVIPVGMKLRKEPALSYVAEMEDVSRRVYVPLFGEGDLVTFDDECCVRQEGR